VGLGAPSFSFGSSFRSTGLFFRHSFLHVFFTFVFIVAHRLFVLYLYYSSSLMLVYLIDLLSRIMPYAESRCLSAYVPRIESKCIASYCVVHKFSKNLEATSISRHQKSDMKQLPY